MKAIVYERYGSADVLQCQDVEAPAPKDDEVLIQVRAASVNPLDWHFMRGTPYFIRLMTGLRKPRFTRLGVDVAGRVEAVGCTVTDFKPGDEVFGSGRGTFAEYACAPASRLAIKPLDVTFEQAATIAVAASTAIQALRNAGRVVSGQRVLINGAAGGVGTFAVQIAKSLGADVTGVCSSRNVDMVRSIGADRVIDYTQEDFTREATQYDVILDCIGNHSLTACRRLLASPGRYVGVGGPSDRWMLGSIAATVLASAASSVTSRKVRIAVARSSREDLETIAALVQRRMVTPVIDRRYPLADGAEAVRYVEQGHARGKVLIMAQEG